MKNLHFDGYKNVLTQYNAQKDSDNAWGFSSAWWIPAAIISQHYYSDGLFSKIVDVPAEEATKHGFDLGIDEDEIRDKVYAKLDDLDIEQKLSTGIKWQRLYGGAIGVMITDDADRLDTPLDLNTVKNITEIRIVESPLIVPDWMSLYRGGYGKIGVPEYFIVNSTSGTFTAHSSRCLMFRNGIMPEHSMPDAMRFWGVPEYMRIKDIVRNTVISHEYAVKMLERSVQGVYKMKDLAALVATQDGEGQILERLNLLDMARGLINSIAIDADNESYDFVTFQLSGIKEAVDTQCNMLSAVTNIPQTLLFGRSPDGMNATGESDFESYYSGIERLQRLYLKPNINKLMDVVLACLKNSGEIDEIPDISISFNPLKVIDEDQQTALNQAKADYLKGNLETAMQLVDAQIINPEEIRASIVKNKTFTLENLFAEIAEKEENGNNESNPDITEDTPIDIDFSGILGNDNKTDIKEDTPIEITLTDDSEALQEDSEQSITKDTPIEVELPKYTSAAIIVMNDKGQVLVGDRADGNGLCGAGGHIEEGESPIVAAIRECSEEFGITPEHIMPIGAIDNLPEQFGKPFVYMGFHYGSIKEVQPEEIKNPRFLDISEICNGEHNVFEPFNRSLDMFKSVLGVEDKSESQEDAITTDSEIKIELTEEKPEIKHEKKTDSKDKVKPKKRKGTRKKKTAEDVK